MAGSIVDDGRTPDRGTVWQMWSRRNTVAMALMMFGLGFVVIGASVK